MTDHDVRINGRPSPLESHVPTRTAGTILVVGAEEASDRIKAIEAGAHDLLSKPIDQPELRARVRSLMQLKHFTDDPDSAEAVLRSLALMIEARATRSYFGCGTIRMYGFGDFQPCG